MAYKVNYEQTLDELKNAAEALLTAQEGRGHFFQTQDRKKLFNKYLHTIATVALAEGWSEADVVELRQSLNCSHCHRFMNRVGAVIYMELNNAVSVFWNPDVVSDPIMKKVVAELKTWVQSGRIHNVFDASGAYATYTEHTHNTQDRRHFYINPENLLPRSTVNGMALKLPHQGTFYGRMKALEKFALAIKLPTLMTVDQWFQTKLLTPVGEVVETMKSLKNLLTTVATWSTRNEMIGETAYQHETSLLNMIWRYGLSDTNLLTAKNSVLGVLLTRLQDFTDGKRPDDSIEKIKASYVEQTDALNYQRTTAPASVNQVELTRLFLEENNYLRSLEQVEALESEVPAIWVSKGTYSEEQPVEEASEEESSFTKFADSVKKAPKVGNGVLKATGLTDIGYFFNEILPNIVSMALVLSQNAQLKPTFVNRMKFLDAKPIFSWDTEEDRKPFIMYGYETPFAVVEMVDKSVPSQNGNYFVNVLSVTTPSTFGVDMKSSSGEPVIFSLDGLRGLVPPRPALFATELKGELYPHHRALEDYSAKTHIKLADGQPMVGFMSGPRHPHAHPARVPGLEARVKFTPEYAALIGSEYGVYTLDLQGYLVPPDLNKFPVLRKREPVAPVPAAGEVNLSAPAIQTSQGADLQ